MKNIKEKLVSEYIKQAQIHGECTESGNNDRGNVAYDKINNVYKQLKRVDPDLESLSPLLINTNLSVRSWAAFHLLPKQNEKAEKVLEEISKMKGLVAFSAGITLREWKKGVLKID